MNQNLIFLIKHIIKESIYESEDYNENDKRLSELSSKEKFDLKDAIEFLGPEGEDRLNKLWRGATDSRVMYSFLKHRTNLHDDIIEDALYFMYGSPNYNDMLRNYSGAKMSIKKILNKFNSSKSIYMSYVYRLKDYLLHLNEEIKHVFNKTYELSENIWHEFENSKLTSQGVQELNNLLKTIEEDSKYVHQNKEEIRKTYIDNTFLKLVPSLHIKDLKFTS